MTSPQDDAHKPERIIVNLVGDDLSFSSDKPVNASTNATLVTSKPGNNETVDRGQENSSIPSNISRPFEEMAEDKSSPLAPKTSWSEIQERSMQQGNTSTKSTENVEDDIDPPEQSGDFATQQDMELLKLRELDIVLNAPTSEKSLAGLVTLFGRWRRVANLTNINKSYWVADNPWHLRNRILNLFDKTENIKRPKSKTTDALEKLRTNWLVRIEKDDKVKKGYDILKAMAPPASVEDLQQNKVSGRSRRAKKLARQRIQLELANAHAVKPKTEEPEKQKPEDPTSISHETNSACSKPNDESGVPIEDGRGIANDNDNENHVNWSTDSNSDGQFGSPRAKVTGLPPKRSRSSAQLALETDKLALKRRKMELKAELEMLELEVAEKERIQKHELQKCRLKIEAEVREKHQENMEIFANLLFKFAKSLMGKNDAGQA